MRQFPDILLTAILLVSLLCQHIHGYGNGADESVCGSMIPGHGADPQISENPYRLTLNDTSILGGETVAITLTSKNAETKFKGFLIQVRKSGENKSTGKFKVMPDDENVRTMNCFKLSESAVTHSNSNIKSSVTAYWTAPNEADGYYDIYYTVVGVDGGQYWTANIHSEQLTVVKNSASSTSETPRNFLPSDSVLKRWRNIYGGCGSTKGCFGVPGKCIQEYDAASNDPVTCEMMVTWKLRNGKNVYELTGRYGTGDSGYVAVGLSEDSIMGNDSVVGCSFREGKGEIKRYYNDNYKVNQGHTPSNLGLTITSNPILEDGNLFCGFEQTNHKIDQIENKVNFADNKYYYLLSRAPAIQDRLPRHPTPDDRDASYKSAHISENIII